MAAKNASLQIYEEKYIYDILSVCMDNIQQIADAVQKGL